MAQQSIVLELDPHVAAELKQQDQERLRKRNRKNQDEWDNFMPLNDNVLQHVHCANKKDDSVPVEDQPQSITRTIQTLPQVLLDWEGVVGYRPEPAAVSELSAQLCGALWEGDTLQKLFDAGVAWHSETDGRHDDDDKFLRVDYPDQLDDGTDTAFAWSHLHVAQTIPVVERLWKHLRSCHRPLAWKYGMHMELDQVVQQEIQRLEAKRYSHDWHAWKSGSRAAKLQELYVVREALVDRLDEVRGRVKEMEEERDERVAAQVEKLGQGIQSFDLEYANFVAFPPADNIMDDFKSIFNIPEDRHDEPDPLDSYESVPDDYADVEDEEVIVPVAPRPVDENDAFNVVEETEYSSRLDEAKAKEQDLRDELTSPELRVAAAAVLSLEEKIEQVDNLLEAIQEEEWAAEEEEEQKNEAYLSTTGTVSELAYPADEDGSLSLLDQVLAMILGATKPLGGEFDLQRHVRFLEQEHKSIRNEWISYFGRLPPLTRAVRTVETAEFPDTTREVTEDKIRLREKLGIQGNPDKEWDEQSSASSA